MRCRQILLNSCNSQSIDRLLSCHGNADIKIYRLIQGATPELCPSDCPPQPNPFLRQNQPNPFLSSATNAIAQVWNGCGIAVKGTASKEARERWGKLDRDRVELTISRDESVATGEWAFIQLLHVEESLSGKIESIDRTSPFFYKLVIDTSKVVPFVEPV